MAGLGTGLGVVKAKQNSDEQFIVEPTECGHMSMILEDDFDMDFMEYIRRQRDMVPNKIVSMEYFISGIGSKMLYTYICEKL